MGEQNIPAKTTKKQDIETYKPTLVESKNWKYLPAFVACLKVKLDSINQYL